MTLSIRFHLDPPVQAAGKHHPTDLKTGSASVRSPWKAAGSWNTIDCRAGWGVKGDSIGGAKCAAGYHGDAVSQATVTAATRAPRFAKAGAWSGSK